MMQDKQVRARTVVEVWLSSLWSNATFSAFKRATRSILDLADDSLDDRVKVIVKYWSGQKKMSSGDAIQFQMQAVVTNPDTNFAMDCCSLAREVDRVRHLRYSITKALYEDHTTTVGSIVMNTVNEAIGVEQGFESCFEAAPSHIHSPRRGALNGSTVIDRTINFFEKNMGTYMRHIQNGTLIFTPKIGTLSESNRKMIREIKAAQPCIISWSNVVDYIHTQTFHTIAKDMSCEDTAHHLHSCNWTARVFGTDVYDIHLDYHLSVYSTGLAHIELGHALLEGFTKQGTYHFRNIGRMSLGRKFVNKFFQYCFEGQTVNCSCFVGVTPLTTPFPLARNVDAAHIRFVYKETGITFGQDTYDFTIDV